MRTGLAWTTLVLSFAVHAGEVNQAAAVTAIREGTVTYDVRSQSEYEAGTVLNAVRVDSRRVVRQFEQTMADKNSRAVIFSSTDARASKAQDQLRKAGYYSVINGGNYEELHIAVYDLKDDPAE
jgi:phage shock protein E